MWFFLKKRNMKMDLGTDKRSFFLKSFYYKPEEVGPQMMCVAGCRIVMSIMVMITFFWRKTATKS